MGGVFVTLCYFGLIFIIFFAWKWVGTVITILTGDKSGLQEFGNLCEKDPPLPYYQEKQPQYYNWKNHWDYYDGKK